MDIKRLNPFRKRYRNAKTEQPDDYHRAITKRIWVSTSTQRHLKSFASQTNRSIAVVVDDVIAKIQDRLLIWMGSKAREVYVKARSDVGIRLVKVSEAANRLIGLYADELKVTKGQALDEIVLCFVAELIKNKRQAERKEREARERFKELPGFNLNSEVFSDEIKDLINEEVNDLANKVLPEETTRDDQWGD